MKQEKKVRAPQQKRSLEKKALIKETALKLFSEKGYFKTTTNEIASCAGLSIGTLYSYFKNKQDIYEELVKDHYEGAAGNADLEHIPLTGSARETMYALILAMWKSHEINTAFQKEMAALSAQSEELRAIEQKYRGSLAPVIAAFLEANKEYYRVTDYNTAGMLIASSLEAVIHETVFFPNNLDQEAVIRELADMFCSYLVKPEYLSVPV